MSVLEGGYGRMEAIKSPNKTSAASSSPPVQTDPSACCYEPLELCDFTANAVAHVRALDHLPMEVIERKKKYIVDINCFKNNLKKHLIFSIFFFTPFKP